MTARFVKTSITFNLPGVQIQTGSPDNVESIRAKIHYVGMIPVPEL